MKVIVQIKLESKETENKHNKEKKINAMFVPLKK